MLVVHSELDPVPDAFSAWLAETMPSARYELLEPSSHFAYASKTRVLLPVVTRFLAEHAG